jgi:hypothetical protein
MILDRWHLPPGGDKALFMEKSVSTSKFVILVCTPKYAERANDREGGVGYEAAIITGQLAENISQNRFIPVLRNGDWKSSLPTWIKSKVGIDLRENPYSESAFIELVRALHGEPLKPPPLGPKPDFASDHEFRSTNPSIGLGDAAFIYSGEPLGDRWVSPPSKPRPLFLPLPDAPVAGSVEIKGSWEQYVDYYLEPDLTLGNRIRYAARFPGQAAVYAYVNIAKTDDGSKHDLWLQHVIGAEDEPIEGSGGERKIYVSGRRLGRGWMSFDVPLATEANLIFPEPSYIYRRVMKFRLRGSLSISPISVFRDELEF